MQRVVWFIFWGYGFIALVINWAAGPEISIAMFLFPYHPVFRQSSLKTGVFLRNLLYAVYAALGAFLVHLGRHRLKW